MRGLVASCVLLSCVASLIGASVAAEPPVRGVGGDPASKLAAIAKLERIKAAVHQVPSRVVGAPELPPAYRVARVFPALSPHLTVAVINEPASRRLLLIEQTSKKDNRARLLRFSGDPASSEFETLIEFGPDIAAFSVTFHPKFAENGFVYIGLNGPIGDDKKKKQTRAVRYTMSRQAPFAIDPKSATVIIEWESNGHNGAGVAFGRDGMLYVTSGDGTSDSDTNLTGQGLDHLLAKLMRIDVDHPAAGQQYSVPADNPFVGQKDVRPETYAYGFRNPWRLFIDQKQDHIWVGNNGQDLWEQVYLVERGANYGWSVYEGGHVFYAERKLGPTPVSKPIFDHPHSESRSLTGGVVYTGKKYPDLVGAYLYGDYSTGKIWAAKVVGRKIEWHKEIADSALQITSFALDGDGELLISDHRKEGEGGLYTLEPNTSAYRPEGFPQTLSQSGLFESVKGHRVQAGLIPYSVNAELWSDGAHKARFIALPPTEKSGDKDVPAQIDLTLSRGWNLPDKTVLVKSFALNLDAANPASRRWVETRFMLKQDGEWVGYSYRWNDDQSDATLVAKEGADRVFEVRAKDGTSRPQVWRYPSRDECMFCHSRAAKYVLGQSLMQMNKEHDYGGVVGSQIAMLDWLGALKVSDGERKTALREVLKAEGLPDKEINERLKKGDAPGTDPVPMQLAKDSTRYRRLVDPYDSTQDLAARARSYLHANCAHCHIEAGGGNAAMELEFTRTLEQAKLLDVTPLHQRFNIPDARLIAPGQPDRSVLLTRLNRRGANSGQMPQIGTNVVDERAVKLFRDWISQLTAEAASK